MGKIVRDSHQTGEQGVVLFSQYCSQHSPFIIFREVTKHDFGIDGELELTRKNEEGKTEATAEILKVQIKTVKSDNSYIHNETDSHFDFFAKKEDIDYWIKHEKYSLCVILVIVDLRQNKIYARKITKIDTYGTKKKKIPVKFDKVANCLEFGTHDFKERFSQDFKSRVNFDATEILLTNSLQVKKFPKYLYKNKSKFNNKKEIFAEVKSKDAPHFALRGDTTYSFREISGSDCQEFIQKVITENKNEPVNFRTIMGSLELTNIYLELFYQHINHELHARGLAYSKDYRRYYFPLPSGKDGKTIQARTRKRNAEKEKKVVTKHTYSKTHFFRHYAVDFKVKFFEEQLHLIVNPKYLFTSDGKETLPPKKITKYTNFLTAREFNSVYANLLHFWKDFFFKGTSELEIYASTRTPILITDFSELTVLFGIAMDTKEKAKKPELKNNQLELL